MKILVSMLIAFSSSIAFGEATKEVKGEHLKVLKNWVVFPFAGNSDNNVARNQAWWKAREMLTKEKKYLVASKQFLIKKDVFQPRKTLTPRGVKLLGNMLNADVLITAYIDGRRFNFEVYLVQNQKLFWRKSIQMSGSARITQQLTQVTQRVVQEMLAVIPYQAYTIEDPIIGKTVYEEAGQKLALVDVGLNQEMKVGTNVQWINVIVPPSGKLSQCKIAIVGEGSVSRVRKGVVVATLDRVTDLSAITPKTLVRIPKQAAKLVEAYTSQAGSAPLQPDIIPTIINPVSPESDEAKKKSLIFGGALSFLGILILAL